MPTCSRSRRPSRVVDFLTLSRRCEASGARPRPRLARMLEYCPKCGHAPLPADQAFPAECPACGVILARAGLAARERPAAHEAVAASDAESLLWHVPEKVDATAFKLRVALLVF